MGYIKSLRLKNRLFKVKEYGVGWAYERILARVASKYDDITYPKPILNCVYVEITTYCNLKCKGCSRTNSIEKHTWHGGTETNWNNQHMSVEEFTEIVNGIPPIRLVRLFGIGEPTMHPSLPELIAIAHSKRKFKEIF